MVEFGIDGTIDSAGLEAQIFVTKRYRILHDYRRLLVAFEYLRILEMLPCWGWPSKFGHVKPIRLVTE